MSFTGAEAGIADGEAGGLDTAHQTESPQRRGSEPLLASLDAIVSDIRVLGGAVEASSSSARRLETAD